MLTTSYCSTSPSRSIRTARARECSPTTSRLRLRSSIHLASSRRWVRLKLPFTARRSQTSTTLRCPSSCARRAPSPSMTTPRTRVANLLKRLVLSMSKLLRVSTEMSTVFRSAVRQKRISSTHPLTTLTDNKPLLTKAESR